MDEKIRNKKESGVEMKVTLVDRNMTGIESMIQALGICRGKDCTKETLEKALEARPVPHLSVLEFGWVMLKVEGVSVKTRIQLERHRLFSSMERSTRSIDVSEAEPITPETVKDKAFFNELLEEPLESYQDRLLAGESLEDCSYLLPLAIGTDFFLAGNLRVWFEYFQKRLCKKHVQDEHYRLAREMHRIIRGVFPIVDKAVPCPTCGECANEKLS